MTDSALMLSISGLRGLIGQSLTPPVASRYGAAVGTWMRDSTRKASPHLIVGRDSRPSGEMIERAVVAGLTAVGCRVTMLGIASTPATAVMVEHLRADGGLVITASHNPVIWNGIKTLSGTGVPPVIDHGRDARATAPPPHQAEQIIAGFQGDEAHYVDVHALHPVHSNDTAAAVHVDRVLPHIDSGTIRGTRGRRPRVVLDSVHGAGGPEAARLLKELGADLVHLYAEPTGQFPHTPEPTAENLTGLCDAIVEHGGDIGFAQDPDADRLALVDETGRYIGEEYTLALCAMHVLGRGAGARAVEGRDARPTEKPHTLVANLSTSRMIDDIAARFGAMCIRTPVGEANVASAMRDRDAIFGGEGNGGVILPGVCLVRDSLVGIALILEMLATTGKKLSELVAEIPAYSIVKDRLPIQPGMAQQAVHQLRQTFADQRIDLQDGIRIDLEAARSWVHVRPSNTEPILRLIAEAPSEAEARDLIRRCREVIEH